MFPQCPVALPNVKVCDATKFDSIDIVEYKIISLKCNASKCFGENTYLKPNVQPS